MPLAESLTHPQFGRDGGACHYDRLPDKPSGEPACQTGRRRWLVYRGGFEQFTLAPVGFAHALREARNVDGGNGSGTSMLLRGDLFRTTLQIGEALTVLRKLLQ